MANARKGSIHLFRLAGVDLYLHWSWFVIAAIEIEYRKGAYSSVAWNVAEYVALFLIVLTHEFGHAMACRQVGGTANEILLWPFGGVAYVNPPQRPGAQLWSIAAGPLVNVALAPLLYAVCVMARSAGWAATQPDAYLFVWSVFAIDVGLFVFNILPIYPMDGGQILRSLLWFVLGRGRSLMVAVVVGFLGGAALIGYAVWTEDLWLGAITVYLLMNCWAGLQHARGLLKLEKLPRRPGFACPSCRMQPLLGAFWKCGQCQQNYDTFATGAECPHCGARSSTTTCADCREAAPMEQWTAGAKTHAGFVSGTFETK